MLDKDSESLKILDIQLREVGAQRLLKKTKNRRRPRKVKKKTFFFPRRFQTIFKQKCSYLRPLLSITFPQEFRISKNIGHSNSGSGGTKTVKKDRKPKKTEKSEEKNFFFARRFQTIFKQKCSYLRPLLSITFTKDSESLKILDIRLREVGAKSPLNAGVNIPTRSTRLSHGQSGQIQTIFTRKNGIICQSLSYLSRQIVQNCLNK